MFFKSIISSAILLFSAAAFAQSIPQLPPRSRLPNPAPIPSGKAIESIRDIYIPLVEAFESQLQVNCSLLGYMRNGAYDEKWTECSNESGEKLRMVVSARDIDDSVLFAGIRILHQTRNGVWK